MRTVLRSALLASTCWAIGTATSSAMPITWQASGVIETLGDNYPFGDLDAISVGTAWTLELTFDPDASGFLLHNSPGVPPTYHYKDVVSASFLLGTFEYTSLGDIFVNADLPVFGSSTVHGKPGLVQFQMHDRWSTAAGGPDLNAGTGLMLASYNDVNAVDGSLPSIPVWSAEQGLFHGLLWSTYGQVPNSQFTSSFNPSVVPTLVPEPATLLLVGSGIALAFARRRART